MSARRVRPPQRRLRAARRGSRTRLSARLRGLLRALRRAPPLVQLGTGLAVLLAVAFAVNGVYQLVRKPTELFFPVSGVLYKTPADTWREYGPLFRRYSTASIPPELLAALAQVEASGNPLARTYWRWAWKLRPFEVYRPASSAVGMYQITDSTFAEARHYCVHDHRLTREGRWDEWHTCWLNGLYLRVVPAPGGRGAPVRRGCGACVRAPRLRVRRGRAVRGSRSARLPGAGRRHAGAVRAPRGGRRRRLPLAPISARLSTRTIIWDSRLSCCSPP
jgi:Transglycosylase SLT domain